MNSTIIFNTICVINIFLGVISIPPCFMAGIMGLYDSPESNKSFWGTLFCYFIISFPVVSLLCGIIPRYYNNIFSSMVLLFPIGIITLLVFYIYINRLF